MPEFVAKVRAAVNIRFQGGSPPTTLFTDRGNGFYDSGSGAITATYKAELSKHGLKAFFGNDAATQPGQLQEVMLHETAVSWLRQRLTKTRPKEPWAESVEAYKTRLKLCAAHCNAKYDVDGLCRALPKRLEMLEERGGDRISK